MAKKKANPQIPKQTTQKINIEKPLKAGNKQSFKLEIPSLPRLTPYLPGILLFFFALIIGLLTYKDYGIVYDEPLQRAGGLLSYNYVFNGDKGLLFEDFAHRQFSRVLSVGWELLLVIFEKMMRLTDSRDIYLMRHIATHILFLISALSLYILAYRLFKNKFIACLGFVMLAFAPRLYGHSFFNSKDLPFLSMLMITLAFCQVAFEKKKLILFFIAGLLCGYTTSIRIMGIMLCIFIFIFLLIDLVTDLMNKKSPVKAILNICLFFVGFCLSLYATWPYLWEDPFNNFSAAFNAYTHFSVLNETLLVNGKHMSSVNLPWTYFPKWFLVTNPEIWLLAGFAGVVLIVINFLKKPFTYINNTPGRNFLLYLMCFFGPVLAVILFHSVIYDDWRHLYFVYPPFVLIALYFINKMLQTRYKLMVEGICILQIVFIGYFLVRYHPFGQLYFNNLTSHKTDYLRNNYDMEYWGSSYKQGLDYILSTDQSKTIKVNCSYTGSLDNNLLLLPEEDRQRIVYSDRNNADYFFPFLSGNRGYDEDYVSTKIDSITVLNSVIFYIIKEEKDPVKLREMRNTAIINLKKILTTNPNDSILYVKVGYMYLKNDHIDSAEYYINRALQFDLKDDHTLNDIAGIYFSKGQYPMAILLCNKVLKINPQDVDIYANMGLAYLKMGKLDSALMSLYKGISIDPGFANSYYNLALTYQALGKLDSVKKYEGLAKSPPPKK